MIKFDKDMSEFINMAIVIFIILVITFCVIFLIGFFRSCSDTEKTERSRGELIKMRLELKKLDETVKTNSRTIQGLQQHVIDIYQGKCKRAVKQIKKGQQEKALEELGYLEMDDF